MHERCKPDPFLYSRARTIYALPNGRATAPIVSTGILAREPPHLFMIAGQLKRPLKQMIQVNFLANYLTGRRAFAFMNKVATSKFVGSQPESFCNLIHLALES